MVTEVMMNPMTNSHIQIKFFLGFLLKGEIKGLLNQNHEWKFSDQKLVMAHFQKNDYIGFSVDSSLDYTRIKKVEKELKELMLIYWPKLNVEGQKTFLFPELFVK